MTAPSRRSGGSQVHRVSTPSLCQKEKVHLHSMVHYPSPPESHLCHPAYREGNGGTNNCRRKEWKLKPFTSCPSGMKKWSVLLFESSDLPCLAGSTWQAASPSSLEMGITLSTNLKTVPGNWETALPWTHPTAKTGEASLAFTFWDVWTTATWWGRLTVVLTLNHGSVLPVGILQVFWVRSVVYPRLVTSQSQGSGNHPYCHENCRSYHSPFWYSKIANIEDKMHWLTMMIMINFPLTYIDFWTS